MASIAGRTDVTLNAVQDGQVLAYDSDAAKWQNQVTAAGSRTSFVVVSNTNGTWPTFQSVYPDADLPLPSTAEVKWYVRSSAANATVPSQFEDIDAPSRPIGGIHSLWGHQ